MNDARALLDSIMGPSRNKSQEEQQKGDGWKEKNVCKRYLVGFCPNDCNDNWFHNTRRDTGTCQKIHSDRLKQDFEQHPDHDKYELEYERDFLSYLEGQIGEADAWISREKSNCSGPSQKTNLTDSQKQHLAKLQEDSEAALKKAEDLAESGDLTSSRETVELSRKLKEEATTLKESHQYMSVGEEVCAICGVRGSRDPGEQGNFKAHFEAHFNGNLHKAMVRIRDKAKELRDKAKDRGSKTDRDEKKKGGKDDKAEDEKKNGRKRDRSEDEKKNGGKDDRKRSKSVDEKKKGGKDDSKRDRKGDKDAGRDRKKSRDRDRDRKGSRSRDRDRDRKRSRSRSRGRRRK